LADPSTVSIVIPAMNEADAIGSVVSRLRAAAAWREIIVVDDGSADETAAADEASIDETSTEETSTQENSTEAVEEPTEA